MAASSSNGGSSSSKRRITSIVEDHGEYSSLCGYCKSGLGTSHGMHSVRLHVNDYQELLDRGWRRSGFLLYKPDRKTCCPPYTIRLNVDDFVASKEQVRVRRRMNRYLEGESRSEDGGLTVPPMDREREVDDVTVSLVDSLRTALREWLLDAGIGSNFQVPEIGVRKMSDKVKNQLKESSGETIYTSNAAFLVAAALKKTVTLDVATDVVPAVLASQLEAKLSNQQLSGVVVKACKGHINFHLSSSSNGKVSPLAGTAKGTDTKVVSSAQETPMLMQQTRRTLEIQTHRSAFDHESFELYRKYQVLVHNDRPEDVQESSYKRFLVDSPLVPSEGASTSYGSFHQQYRIDGRLVAVGVVDILPKCLSSKYLFWDPDFAFLSLGKFSALQEIEWVKAAGDPSLRYYYLGYYIHSCPKMRYKAAYAPSELLCPTTMNWIPFGVARPLVETGQSVCLSAKNDGNSSREPRETSWTVCDKLCDIPLLLHNTGRCVLVKDLEVSAPQWITEKLKHQLLAYWRLVGDGLAARMAYCYSLRPKFS